MFVKKIVVAGIAILFCSIYSIAQDNAVKSISKLELGLGGLGFGYEAKISKAITMEMNAGIGGHYHVDDQTFSYVLAHSKDQLSPAYYVSINPRFYYNLEERAAHGKSNAHNAANYIGIKAKYAAGFKNDVGTFLANIHWGMQRSFGNDNRWLLNTMAGMGIAANIKTMYNGGTFYPAVDFKIGYRLSK